MEEKKDQERLYRVVTFLNRQELDFLDILNKDIYFSNGINIPRTKLIEEIIEVFKSKDAQDRQALEQGLLRMFKEEAK